MARTTAAALATTALLALHGADAQGAGGLRRLGGGLRKQNGGTRRLRCATYTATDPMKMEERSVHQAIKIEDEIEAEQMYVTMSASARRIGAVKAILHAYSIDETTNEIVHTSATLFSRNGKDARTITDAVFDPRAEEKMPEGAEAEPFTGKWAPGQAKAFREMKAGELPLAGQGGSKGVWMLELEDVLEAGNADARMDKLSIEKFQITFCDKDGQEMPENPMAVSSLPEAPAMPVEEMPMEEMPMEEMPIEEMPMEEMPMPMEGDDSYEVLSVEDEISLEEQQAMALAEEASMELGIPQDAADEVLSSPLEVVPAEPTVADRLGQTASAIGEAIANVEIPASGIIPGVSIPLLETAPPVSPEQQAALNAIRVEPSNEEYIGRTGIRISADSNGYDRSVLDVPSGSTGGFGDFITGIVDAIPFLPSRDGEGGETPPPRFPTLFPTARDAGDDVTAEGAEEETGPIRAALDRVPELLRPIPLEDIPAFAALADLNLTALPGLNLTALPRLNLTELPRLNLTELPRLNLTAINPFSTDLPGPFVELPALGDLQLPALGDLQLPALGDLDLSELRIRLPFMPSSDEEAEQMAEEIVGEIGAEAVDDEAAEAGSTFLGLPAFRLPTFGGGSADAEEVQAEVAAQSIDTVDAAVESLPVEEQAEPTMTERLISAPNPQARPIGAALFGGPRPSPVDVSESVVEEAEPEAPAGMVSAGPTITYEEEPEAPEAEPATFMGKLFG